MFEIRRAISSDAAKIAEAEREIFPDAWREGDVSATICEPDGSMCYAALADGEICAYLLGRIVAPEGEIYRIATLPKYRGRGIARALLQRAFAEKAKCGLESLFLEVRSQNLPARTLYLSCGFIKVGVRKNYYKNPTDDAIIMLKSFSDEHN